MAIAIPALQLPTIENCKALGCQTPPVCTVAPVCPLKTGLFEGLLVTAISIIFGSVVMVLAWTNRGSVESISGIITIAVVAVSHVRNTMQNARISKAIIAKSKEIVDNQDAARQDTKKELEEAKKVAEVAATEASQAKIQTERKGDEVIRTIVEKIDKSGSQF